MKQVVLFDLDGTLTDSSKGIMASITYMLKELGLEIPADDVLRSFIGPPLSLSLGNLYGMDKEAAQKATLIYRDYYAEQGIHELEVYPGIAETLADLSKDYTLGLATSKPAPYAEQIIGNLGFADYFTGVFGADMDGRREGKATIIKDALTHLTDDLSQVVMVGDREFDIKGAKENGIASIGVLYGFGDLEELQSAGADRIVENAGDIPAAVRELL
ncbi:HAD hydrolase-like protein [Enterococcus sp. 669A]|uniref:HAD hydrolase-like protein n=1 Tax=Candidatus Enterococcus moelleringii TaxID=2815325 RepID=A0ABS3LHA5_9ENTE|nr:NIF family HAD-type phosphatase [Enterococcus sp. 669A]MBO1307729.1 HAD hydrolase-like protein [Enterococcus sp. 669A]